MDQFHKTNHFYIFDLFSIQPKYFRIVGSMIWTLIYYLVLCKVLLNLEQDCYNLRGREVWVRHVHKTPFVINLLGWLTFIYILALEHYLSFLIKLSFQDCMSHFIIQRKMPKIQRNKRGQRQASVQKPDV